MTAEVQRIVDDLAARLHRPVLIEDHHQHVIAYSEHNEPPGTSTAAPDGTPTGSGGAATEAAGVPFNAPIDAARRNSIMRRRATPEVRAWLRAAGVQRARRPVRTPAAPHLGLLPRLCVPVWHRELLLGYLWLIEGDQPLNATETGIAAASAGSIGLGLYHESVAAGLGAQYELDAVRALLLDDTPTRAAATLIEAGGYAQSAPVVALVAYPTAPPSEETRAALERSLLGARHRLSRDALHLVRYDHGVLLAPAPCADLLAGEELVIGVGALRPELSQARDSYAEALRAAQVAARVPGTGPIADWSRLGVYRLLCELPSPPDHPGLAALRPHASLLETLETYLDLAGNATATAERLRLHRTTLYYRLKRIEELAGTDLHDGTERLTLHLALKLARLNPERRP